MFNICPNIKKRAFCHTVRVNVRSCRRNRALPRISALVQSGAYFVARQEQVVADLVIGYKMFQEKFISEVTLDRPHAITVQYRSGPLSHLSNAWEFKSKGRKGCEISFHVDFDFHSPLLRAAMSIFFDKALSKMVAAFEARAKEMYG